MHRVVIVGGGFGGLQAALHLKNADVEVTLVDRRNFHLFQPLAYQVATGALAAGEVCYPLRAIFRGEERVRVMLAEATGFDLDARTVALRTAAGERDARLRHADRRRRLEVQLLRPPGVAGARRRAEVARGRAAHPRADPAGVRGRRAGRDRRRSASAC